MKNHPQQLLLEAVTSFWGCISLNCSDTLHISDRLHQKSHIGKVVDTFIRRLQLGNWAFYNCTSFQRLDRIVKWSGWLKVEMSGREVSWRERIISAGADPAPLHPEVFRFMSVFVFVSVFVSVFVHSSVFVAVIIVLSLCVCVLPDQNISGRAHMPTTRPPSISDSWQS